MTLAPSDRRFKYFLVVIVLFTLGNSSGVFPVLRAQTAGLPLVGVLGMVFTFDVSCAALAGPASAAGVLWQGAFEWEGLGAGAPFYFGAALAALLPARLPPPDVTESPG